MAELGSDVGGEATGRTAFSVSLTVLCVCVFVCFSAWARVELTVSPSVEVFLGDAATIQCQHTFKDISQEPRLVITQMFVVSPTGRRNKAEGENI